ncbi:MAG: DeoR/GlpR family DNA-binding transcription regulator [Hespellia sp.]|nr:DeoR/GlpR family DNA-binding transcription regulator [Hespellia sp.]
MFKVERIRRIKEILRDCHQIEVSVLSNLLNVSDATIRNDLEELEQDGFLTRFHGGATFNSPDAALSANSQSSLSAVEYHKDKEEIGIIASRLIQEREWIFLGPGTTTYYIAKALRERGQINVLTNNFLVANVLYDVPTIRLVFLGGQVDHLGNYTVPDDLDKELQNIYLDKAFFSVDGVDLNAGYTLSDKTVFDIIHAVMRRSREPIMAADCSKFEQTGFMTIGDLSLTPTIITNAGIPEEYKQYYLDHDIRVYSSFDLKPAAF